jgi:hypothetical protein
MAGGERGEATEGAGRRARADGGQRWRGQRRTDGTARAAAVTRRVRV